MTKVLIVHPDFSRLGGIENYYRKLDPYLKVPHESFGNSRRRGEAGLVSRVWRILGDYRRFWLKLSDADIDIVHLNPSLEPRMFYRESIFLLLARMRGKKTVVFFRGWSIGFQQQIDSGKGRLFRLLYGKADVFIVLASSFADTLRNWGISQPVHTEVTIIDDDALSGFDLEATLEERLDAHQWQLLFPSRLMKSKGILTAIEALKYVQQSHPGFGLLVAGDGELADKAQAFAMQLGVQHVNFLGIVSGDEKSELFRTAHILCFPTEHNEGFPNTIVEAMAFGLPVVTRPVGGIPDFFISGEHGYITASTAPEDFAQLVIRIAGDPEHYRQMARANHQYAQDHFLASQAARRLEQIYSSL